MPPFCVKVVASYPATEVVSKEDSLVYTAGEQRAQSGEVKLKLGDWVSAKEGRKLTGSYAIEPPRLTLEVTYDEIDAPPEWDARVDGISLFREESSDAELPEPETVVAHAEAL
jgi:hypothetical protein